MVEIAVGISKIPVTPRSKQTGGAETERPSTGYCTHTARGALELGHRGIIGIDLRPMKGIF